MGMGGNQENLKKIFQHWNNDPFKIVWNIENKTLGPRIYPLTFPLYFFLLKRKKNTFQNATKLLASS